MSEGGARPSRRVVAATRLKWAALSVAPPYGTTVPELMAETGMSRPWVYQRLSELSRAGQLVQIGRGRWRAATDDSP
jgi:DNA-binding IclR family transcriptional regulator